MNLQLSLKNNWFEMTKAGIKCEDYREITPYWVRRFFNGKFEADFTLEMFTGLLLIGHQDSMCMLRLYGKRFTTNTMTLGYPKSTDKERIIVLEHKGIEIRTGNPEWGAEEGKLYFVIKHGEIIES